MAKPCLACNSSRHYMCVYLQHREGVVSYQYSGRLYHVHVRCEGGVGSRSLLVHRERPPTLVSPSGASGALMKSMKASLDWKGALMAALLGKRAIMEFLAVHLGTGREHFVSKLVVSAL